MEYRQSEGSDKQIHVYEASAVDGLVDKNTLLAMDEALVNDWEKEGILHSSLFKQTTILENICMKSRNEIFLSKGVSA